MLLVVMAAAALVIIVMVVLMLLMMIAAAALVVIVMVVMMFHLKICQFSCQSCLAFHGIDQLLTGQVRPGRGDDSCGFIMLADQGNASIQLCLRYGICTGKNDCGSGFDLVVIKLTEILHVNLDLTGIRYGDSITKGHIFIRDLVDSADHIGQLAHTGGLDDDTVRIILLDDLCQRLAEIAHQRAANAAGVHFGDIDTCILQETAVDANFAEFILNQHQFLALIAFSDHFLDQGRFTGTQKTGIDVYFCHLKHLLYINYQDILYHRNFPMTSQMM